MQIGPTPERLRSLFVGSVKGKRVLGSGNDLPISTNLSDDHILSRFQPLELYFVVPFLFSIKTCSKSMSRRKKTVGGRDCIQNSHLHRSPPDEFESRLPSKSDSAAGPAF